MKYCVACNPRSELLTDENGELYCRFHGKDYTLEETVEPATVEETPSEPTV